jgi:hypothetical protein
MVGVMRINKAIIISLMIPLVSGIYTVPARAIGMATLSRPSATSRLPTARPNTMQIAPVINTKPSADAGLVATCANPLPERLASGRCIDRYESCLRQDNVCGEHFELCYNLKQFNKSRIMCQEFLAQCPAEAIKALFGNSVTTSDDMAAANRTMCDGESVLTKRTFTPALGDIAVATESRIDLAIKDGKNWAAANSVKTCNKAADACIQNACKGAPHKCISLTGFSDIDASEMVNIATSGETTLRLNPDMLETWIYNMGWDDSNVKNYIKEQCRDTIGTNEWCFMVTNGKPAKEVDLTDSFNIQEVYQDIMYNGVGARWKMAQSKIKEWAALAAKNSVEQCKNAITDCAVNACGEGSRARCYGLAKVGNTVSIKNKAAHDITGQCKNLIENNQYCKDVFRNKDSGSDGDVWDAVWTNDSIGAIVGLDTDLQKAFNEQAVAGMRTSCQAQVEKCVEDECGNDFSRCFITSSAAIGRIANNNTTNNLTIEKGFINKSKGLPSTGSFVGGFDTEMARDLCMLKVKKFTDCIDYFDVQYARNSKGTSADSWGTSNNVRNAWLDATSNNETSDNICRVSETYFDKVDNAGNVIDPTVKISTKIKICATQEQSIFDGLLADIGKRANSVLEREANDIKNACENSNIKGSTSKDYIWASLSDIESLDNEYEGLNKVTATNNPFDGFCAVKVTMRSNNAKVQEVLKENENSVRYYPKGTTMQCLGLTTEQLEKIERKIAEEIEFCKDGKTPSTHNCSEKLTGLQKTLRIGGATLGSLVIGGLGGVMAGNAIQNATRGYSTNINADKITLYNKCHQCIEQKGKNYSTQNPCQECDYIDNTKTPNCDPVGSKALKLCQSTYNDINTNYTSKTKNPKNHLLNFDTKGAHIGAITTGVVSAVAGGMIAGNAINQKEAQALEEARQKAIEDFNKQTDINCYIGGRKVASYGQEMVIK